jgi:hypothetical protein
MPLPKSGSVTMQILDLINAATGGSGLTQLGKQFGLNDQQIQSAAGQLLPAILGGVKKQAQGGNGLEDLLGQLGGNADAYLQRPDALARPEASDAGNVILGQIFGSKDVSRTVATHAAQSSGVSTDILKKLLPLLAMLATGALAKQGAAAPEAGGGGLGGLVGSVLGGLLGGGQQKAPAGGGIGGLAQMLDLDGDGNPLDDIMGMAGKIMGR